MTEASNALIFFCTDLLESNTRSTAHVREGSTASRRGKANSNMFHQRALDEHGGNAQAGTAGGTSILILLRTTRDVRTYDTRVGCSLHSIYLLPKFRTLPSVLIVECGDCCCRCCLHMRKNNRKLATQIGRKKSGGGSPVLFTTLNRLIVRSILEPPYNNTAMLSPGKVFGLGR